MLIGVSQHLREESMDGLNRLRRFLGDMTGLCEAGADEGIIRAQAGASLRDLVNTDDWLPLEFAKPDPAHYRQYLLYCDPLERFSVVSFVWGPGQRTPVHDHTVWGLIGMLRGAEISRNFAARRRRSSHSNRRGTPGSGRGLRCVAGDRRYPPGRERFDGSPFNQHPCLRRQYRGSRAPRLSA